MEATLQHWQLFFFAKDGIENRNRTMTDFFEFVKSDKQVFEPTGHMYLYGQVTGNPKFSDGSYICSSCVVKIERRVAGPQPMILAATTYSGSIYTFESTDCLRGMRLMIEDYTQNGKLSSESGRYVQDFGDAAYNYLI